MKGVRGWENILSEMWRRGLWYLGQGGGGWGGVGVEGYKDAGFLSQGLSEHLVWGSPSPVCEQGLTLPGM